MTDAELPFEAAEQGTLGRVHAKAEEPDFLSALEEQRKYLFGLCYRMTSSVTDAEDVVQDTFVRAMERPPADLSGPLRPWLVRVALNLARDRLRRRKRRDYHGVWLPAPLEHEPADVEAPPESSPEAKYGLAESLSYGFLVALETLTPAQRAVLLLRDAFDYTSKEAAEALDISEENVRITLHRARRAMEAYDARRLPLTEERRKRAFDVLVRFLGHVYRGEVDAARALFASDARSLSDGGGVYAATRAPLLGAERITKVYTKLSRFSSGKGKLEARLVNGALAFVGNDPETSRPNAPRFVMLLELDEHDRIRTLYSVVAPEKLGHVVWPGV